MNIQIVCDQLDCRFNANKNPNHTLGKCIHCNPDIHNVLNKMHCFSYDEGKEKIILTTHDLLEIDETQAITKSIVPFPCKGCIEDNKDFCMNVCPIKREPKNEIKKTYWIDKHTPVDLESLRRHVLVCIKNDQHAVAIKHIMEYLSLDKEAAERVFNNLSSARC